MASYMPGVLLSQTVVESRFPRDKGWGLTDMSSDPAGRIALAGYQKGTYNTYVALYSKPKNVMKDKFPFEVFYVREYRKYKHVTAPLVSFLDAQTTDIIVCHNKDLESFDTRKEKVLHSCTLGKTARCMSIYKRKIFIGFINSGDIIVLQPSLERERTITLEGLMPEDMWTPPFDNPYDIAIVQDKILVCSHLNKILSYALNDGKIVNNYKPDIGRYVEAFSITASEENDIICVLLDKSTILVYSLSDSCFLLTLSVFDTIRIRLTSKQLVTIDGKSDISTFYVEDILAFNNFIMTWGSELNDDDGKRLQAYFGVQHIKMRTEDEILASFPQSLLLYLKAQSVFSEQDIRPLVKACRVLGMTRAIRILRNYQLFMNPDLAAQLRESGLTIRNLNANVIKATSEKEKVQREQEEMKENFRTEKVSLVKELEQTKTKLENAEKCKEQSAKQINILQTDRQKAKQLLEEAKTISANETAALSEKLSKVDKLLQQAKYEKRSLKDELAMCQLAYQKESMGIQQLLEQTSDASNEVQMKITRAGNIFQNFSDGGVEPLLAVNYGRLLVGVADSLTLEVSLKLAHLFCLPASEIDLLRRISISETPGTKLLEILKARGIINMYDIDNLQKAFTLLQQEKINRDLLVPYQEKIDSKLRDTHKAKEAITAEAVRSFMNTDGSLTETSLDTPGTDSQAFPTISGNLEPGLNKRANDESNSKGWEKLAPYKECRIGRQGGTINIAGITLSIPEGTLCEDHIIAVGVIGHLDMLSPREEEGVRITPIVQLEPAELVFAVPVLLTVPHSAFVVTEERSYSLTLHAGRKKKDQQSVSDEIAWVDEACLDFPVTEKRISLEINSFGYFFISFESRKVIPVHIVRLLVFVESIINFHDDILITVALCSDCDPVYEMLLSSHRSKILFETDSVMHIHFSEKGPSTSSCVDVALSLLENTHAPVTQEAVMNLDVNQLMSPTGVNQQFKLRKNENEDCQDVSFKITVSQADDVIKEINLKTKIKNLLISRESQNQLLHMAYTDLKLYETLKTEIASRLSEKNISMLAFNFGLNQTEKKILYENENGGWKLMEILSDKNLIQPGKMVKLFEGMKEIYHPENSSLILEYVEEMSRRSSEHDANFPRSRAGSLPFTQTAKAVGDFFRNQFWSLQNMVQKIRDDNSTSTDSTETLKNM